MTEKKKNNSKELQKKTEKEKNQNLQIIPY